MNKFFKITLCVLSILFNQLALSKIVMEQCGKSWILVNRWVKESILQIQSDHTIFVDNIDCNRIMVVLYKNKLKIYYAYPELQDLQEMQKLFDTIDKTHNFHIYYDSNDPIFHSPVAGFKKTYYCNPKDCLIKGEKSIDIQGCIIESPHIVLKAREMKIDSFLIDTQTVEVQSNNPRSLLSSIKFTLKDKTDFQPVIIGEADFDENFVMLICSSVSKIEICCLPESFCLCENEICFN